MGSLGAWSWALFAVRSVQLHYRQPGSPRVALTLKARDESARRQWLWWLQYENGSVQRNCKLSATLFQIQFKQAANTIRE